MRRGVDVDELRQSQAKGAPDLDIYKRCSAISEQLTSRFLSSLLLRSGGLVLVLAVVLVALLVGGLVLLPVVVDVALLVGELLLTRGIDMALLVLRDRLIAAAD